MEEWKEKLEDKFKAISCFVIFILMIGGYIAAGLFSYNLMRPEGFWQSVLWLVGWHILALIVDLLLAGFIVLIEEIIERN
jgi:hypothetical protein